MTKKALRTPAQNRKLHYMCKTLGINKDMLEGMVLDYTNGRTMHSRQMYKEECAEMLNFLDRTLKPKTERRTGVGKADFVTLDRKRKGVIKAIFAYMERQGKQPTMEYVKSIACRAAGKKDFNTLSPAELGRIYAEFCKKEKAAQVKKGITGMMYN